jgi:hypothetical protein
MILRRFTFAYHAVVYWNAAPRGAREAGHSNILWTALLTAWCCSTLGNQHRHFRSQTIRRPNMGATRKSGRGMRKARLWVIWRGYSIFPCSGSVRLCSNGGSKMPIFPKTDERSKPARFCYHFSELRTAGPKQKTTRYAGGSQKTFRNRISLPVEWQVFKPPTTRE